MAAKRKIAILLHEKDSYPKSQGHFIWSLCDVWRERGIEIEVLKGVSKYVEADLLIPHVDATVLPPSYVDFFKKYPRVVNRQLQDISKRFISRNLLTRTDAYDGPVIVKTNLNCGGLPEARFQSSRVVYTTKKKRSFWDKLLRRQRKNEPRDWSEINCMDTEDYQIFPSLSSVPATVFTNESLVVERFLPEIEDGIYYLRIYKFLGDRSYGARLGSLHPIVKNKNIVSREEVAVPDEVVAFCRAVGMDYGKLDFVIHDGRFVILDVNRTPGGIASETQMKANALKLADGINDLF